MSPVRISVRTSRHPKLLHDFDRVVLACGASNPETSMRQAEMPGDYFAVDFLKANTKSLLDSNFEDKKYVETKGKNVVIIGGGDTGNDCVGTSIRHGAKSVTQIEMMPKAPDKRAENNPLARMAEGLQDRLRSGRSHCSLRT